MTEEEYLQQQGKQPDTAAAKKESARRTRRSFLVGSAAVAGTYGFYRYLDRAPADQMVQRPLRRTLDFNAELSRDVFGFRAETPTYPVSRATDLRINGNAGLERELKPESWRLQLVGVRDARSHPQYVDDVTAWKYEYTGAPPVQEDAGAKLSPAFQKAFAEMRAANGDKPQRGTDEAGESDSGLDPGTPGLLLTMDDVRKLPHQGLVTQFKCIEGWSQIVQWGGVRLADLMRAYPPAPNAQGRLPRYVYMETPDGNYYCGFDRGACEHPQSLLVTEMAGKPLTGPHGAPLRLHMPIKYGYKQIKRIALIAYTDEKPDDYWTKLGYDWYAGI